MKEKAALLERCITAIQACEEELQGAIEALTLQLTTYQTHITTQLASIREKIKVQTQGLDWVNADKEVFTYQIHTETISALIASLVEYTVNLPMQSERVEMEEDWKPDPNPPKSWTVVSPFDLLTVNVKSCLSRIGDYPYPILIVEGENKEAVELQDGSVYIGQWRNGKRYGKGRLLTPTGTLMEGYWTSGGLHLHGRCITANGDYYEGGYCHMKRHGEGRFVSADRNTSYHGTWSHDLKHGTGTEHLPDGSIYSGDFIHDKKTGTGRFQWPNKEYYEGEFKDMRIEGWGRYVWTDRKWYEGQWLDGKMHGRGKLVNEDKEYEGEFVKDRKHGFGVLKWSGNIYEGDWDCGQMHGKGFLTLKGGSRRQYEFSHNKRLHEVLEL